MQERNEEIARELKIYVVPSALVELAYENHEGSTSDSSRHDAVVSLAKCSRVWVVFYHEVGALCVYIHRASALISFHFCSLEVDMFNPSTRS